MGFFGFGKKNKEKEQEKMKTGLEKTRTGFWGNILNTLTGSVIDDEMYDDLEEQLILADVGGEVAVRLVDKLRDRVREKGLKTGEEAADALRDIIAEEMTPEAEMDLAGKPAVGRVGKRLHALKPFFGFLHFADLRPQIFQNGPIDRKTITDFVLLCLPSSFLLIRLGLCGQHRLHIHLFHALQRFLITLERSLQGSKVLFAFIIRLLGFLYRFFPCLFLLAQLLQCLICLGF